MANFVYGVMKFSWVIYTVVKGKRVRYMRDKSL